MLDFITWTCSIKRYKNITWNKYWKSYEVVETWIEIDIQPDNWQSLWIDFVKDQYKWYIYSEDETLIELDDIIVDDKWIEYTVISNLFWKWNSFMESNFELTLILNKTKWE